MNRLNPSDWFAAAAPVLGAGVGSLTLADWNEAAQLFGALLGGAYLIWKWRREAKAKPAPDA